MEEQAEMAGIGLGISRGDYTGIVVTKSYYHNGKMILRVVCPCISWNEAREYAQHDRTFRVRGR